MNRKKSAAKKETIDWHALSAEETLQRQNSRIEGLSHEESRTRLDLHGENSLPDSKRRPSWLSFLLQFHNPLIYVLLAAGITTLLIENYIDAGVIFGVVLINALIGFIQEGKAEKALEAVRSMLASRAMVMRGGERHNIDAQHLVPGDVVLLESGDKIPADLRLIRVKNLHVTEAVLTGESVPVKKHTEMVAPSASIGDRGSMAYSGTQVAFGQAHGIVVATGTQTEIGRIGSMVGDIQTLSTPLTRRLDQFARRITVFILAVSLITFIYGHYFTDMSGVDIFIAVIGLAVAAIPEGLPAIVTIVLAIGTRIMARNRAIIRRLPAVETLGSVTVICSDKTGTLTRNEMTTVRLMLPTDTISVSGTGYAPDGGFHLNETAINPETHEPLLALARCALLCNDAHLKHDEAGEWNLVGDPTEGALLTFAIKAGLDPVDTGKQFPRQDDIPFESEHRYMATLHHNHEKGVFLLLKGAPERVLELCSSEAGGKPFNNKDWQARIEEAAEAGERVLALATRKMPADTTAISTNDITADFELLGMVGLIDPPREEAIAAVAECQQAGIRVKMITGDHAITAAAIGRQLGLLADNPLTGEVIETLSDEELKKRAMSTDVIARASPEHKLRLVAALQSMGHLVAMTGDGVNDAPALKAADIGVAMGQKGTDAAREASDLVLTDDNFATIAKAVREGRVVFDNIKKSLIFILPTNGGQAGVIMIAIFGGLALPVTAGQILWVNMVTAVTLALALAFEPAEKGVMHHVPRPPGQPLITRPLAMRVLFVSLLMVAVTFIMFEWEQARGSSIEMSRTAAVNMLVVGEMFYLFHARHFTASAFSFETLTGNRMALLVTGILILLQLAFTYAAPMQHLFRSTPLELLSWLMILGLGALLFLAIEAEKAIWRTYKIERM
ncbi:MAG: carbonate dehydratase [Betaproteobacteria bacterium HGW-Betaproteobacteria-2]|nr:MAG: carbonate dehydratase [Betaproteobacteria bacterium HGW-Betaproteobacteria-2]